VWPPPPPKHKLLLGYITGSKMLMLHGQYYDKPGARISGALTYALAQVNADPTLLPNHTLQFVLAETFGEEARSIQQTVQLLNDGIAAYIGPQETCTHEGRVGASFNKPMISYVSSFLFHFRFHYHFTNDIA
jgi:hypothetical protein